MSGLLDMYSLTSIHPDSYGLEKCFVNWRDYFFMNFFVNTFNSLNHMIYLNPYFYRLP